MAMAVRRLTGVEKHRYDTTSTRRDLLDAARILFADVGFAAAGTVEIVGNAGLSRGALYHHFESKEGLFLAVLEQVHVELAAEVERCGLEATGGFLEALRAGFHGHLDAVLDPAVRQILLVDGPAVVGWKAWHELDLQHGFSITKAVLTAAMEADEIVDAPPDELTHVLLGAVTQAGLELGQNDANAQDRTRYHQTIDLLLDGLRVEPLAG